MTVVFVVVNLDGDGNGDVEVDAPGRLLALVYDRGRSRVGMPIEQIRSRSANRYKIARWSAPHLWT